MQSKIIIRDFEEHDAKALGMVALSAFEQYKDDYSDWQQMASWVSNMASLSTTGEIIVAELEGRLVGGVAYIGPNKIKAEYFEQEWPIIRMLVVEPSARGKGLGRKLTEACVLKARRDGSPIIALHTTEIMSVALHMYEHMGFRKLRVAPDILGVPYSVYTKALT